MYVQLMIFEPYITAKEVARAFAVTPWTVHRWRKKEKMPSHFFKKQHVFLLSEVWDWYGKTEIAFRGKPVRKTIGLEIV